MSRKSLSGRKTRPCSDGEKESFAETSGVIRKRKINENDFKRIKNRARISGVAIEIYRYAATIGAVSRTVLRKTDVLS